MINMGGSNWIIFGVIVLFGNLIQEVPAKCILTPLQGERTIAYACVHGDLSDLEEVPSEAEWIELTVSRIHYLPPDAFSRFHDLRRLTFYNCDLRQVSPEAFRGLENLEWLVMSNTKINFASASLFRNLRNLKRLTLDGAGLIYIEPEVFESFNQLETLSLRDNDLDCLPIDALASLTNLKTVQIGKNPWLCDCRNSLGKFFEERMIEHGPDEECISPNNTSNHSSHSVTTHTRYARNTYECMTVLEYPALPAPQATFEEIEQSYRGRYEWHETVVTSITHLDRLPDEIGWIQLFDVKIPTLHRYAFFRFGNTLRSIELRNCGIEQIEREAFAGLHKLERLTLTHNRFTTLGNDWFRDLVRLTDLVLQHNGIEQFEEDSLIHLGALRRLDVRGNRLRCLREYYLRNLKSLERVEATGNPWLCDCRDNLENYLTRMRIGYEISSGSCHLQDQIPISEWHDGNKMTWNTSITGKVRWSWAYSIHRPTSQTPANPPIQVTTTPRIIMNRTRPPRPRGCQLIRSGQRIDSCICTRASLVDLNDVPDMVDSIIYSGSIIPTIHNDVFRKFGRYLRRLEFRECGIQNIERRAFYGLRILETLVIRGNDVDHVKSEWFEEMRNLRKLDISKNGITRISNGVFDRLPYLGILDISDNRMNCIGIEHIESLQHLRQMEIDGNPWTCLCVTRLAKLMKDRKISCNCNPETLIERTEGGWGCHGTDVYPPSGMVRPPGTMPTPTSRPSSSPPVIYPTSTELPPLPPGQASGTCYSSHENLPGGPWYHCTNGDISVLQKIPSYATKIEIIDSYVPHLSAMAFARFQNLTELVLRNCTLRDVDTRAFAGLYRLERLTLRDNRFTVVRNGWFSDTRNLIWLDMSDNYLVEIESGAFDELKKLEYLNLEGSKFQCIYTNCFIGLPRLTTLEFGRNPLKWRCWQELRQFLEVRAIGYTYYKCPHDGKDIVRNLLKDDKGEPGQLNSGAEFLCFNSMITMMLTLFISMMLHA